MRRCVRLEWRKISRRSELQSSTNVFLCIVSLVCTSKIEIGYKISRQLSERVASGDMRRHSLFRDVAHVRFIFRPKPVLSLSS